MAGGFPIILLTFECVNRYRLLACATQTRASSSLRLNDVPLRHRLMLTDNSTFSDEPLISFCRLPQRLLFLHSHGGTG